MALTIANAIKALVESAGLGVSGVRDETSPGRAYPFVKIQENIGMAPHPDANPNSGDYLVNELVQVELLQQRFSPHTNASTESPTLADDLHVVLQGGALETAPKRVYGMRVIGRVRIPDMPTRATGKSQQTTVQPSGVVRTVYTVQVYRTL